jgi:hypothetical protein
LEKRGERRGCLVEEGGGRRETEREQKLGSGQSGTYSSTAVLYVIVGTRREQARGRRS